MSLADHVRTLGRGPNRSRSLSRAEAEDAMAEMLSGRAAPEAVGALLMLLRRKGETPDEIAGFATAAQACLPPMPRVNLDWPSYSAGRTRGIPWFLLSARLVALAGHRVLLHGWNETNPVIRDHLEVSRIPLVDTPQALASALDRSYIAYIPLESLKPALFRLLALRDILGLRSGINTVTRMLNLCRADAIVQGVFHPSFRQLQTDAAHLLGWQALTVIKGGGGEMERHPAKEVTGYGLRAGTLWRGVYSGALNTRSRLANMAETSDLSALWSGDVTCPVATETVIGTAAVALDTLGVPQPETHARELWRSRFTAHPSVDACIPWKQCHALWAGALKGMPRNAWGRSAEQNPARAIKAAIFKERPPEGTGRGSISLVGAGPGARDLLTLRAVERLQEADVIFYDRLVGDDVLELARHGAERVYVGKNVGACAWPQDRINALIVAEARKGCRVVRLKSGDPGVFGRAGEELQAARDASIPVEIVPGVTAAVAAAAAFGESLTKRGVADTLVLSTGMGCADDPLPDTTRLSGQGTTTALYMSVGQAARIKIALLDRGLPPSTRVRVAAKVSQQEQALSECRLDALDDHLEQTGCCGCAVLLVTWPKKQVGCGVNLPAKMPRLFW